jgi:uncharacterized protein involved in type VI secretion and phage assembly
VLHDSALSPFELQIDGFPHHHFRVHSFTGKEAMSASWAFDIVATAEHGGDLVEQKALAARATVLLHTGPEPRALYGIVAAVRVVQAHHADHSVKYQIRVVPRLWLLRRKQRTRIFQKMRVPDIVTAVLQEAGIVTRWQLTRAYPERELVTQFEETDYKFVTRLLAEAGIFFYFFGGGPVSDAALTADAAIGAAASVGESVVGDLAGQDVGGLVGSAVSMAETLIPGDTVVCADDAACYPPVAGDDPTALAASTAAALAPAVGDALGAGDGLAGAAIGAASAVAGTIIAEATEGGKSAPLLRFLKNEEAKVTIYDKVLRFLLRNTVRSSAAAFRDYDPDRPMVRLQSKDVSSAPFPLSPFEEAAKAIAVVENVAGTVEALVPLPSEVEGVIDTVEDVADKADAIANAIGAAFGARVPFEVYEHHNPFLFPKWAFANDEAPKMLRQKRRRASIAKGESGCSDFSPGHRFELREHPVGQLDGGYVVTSVEHHGETHPGEGGGAWRVYENRFECAPAVMAYVPARPKRKSVQVALTATVVGPPGEEIHVDEKGQIKVQFHWDRDGNFDGDSSCWIRVMQPWAGAAWGHQYIPRVGMEVVVTFEGGDPDKPMVLGSVYNGTHPMPFKLPEDKTRSGIRTQSSRGGGGYNELSFEDATAREQIYVHAERDLDVVVKRDHTLEVRRDERIRILGDRLDRVERNLEELVGGDHRTKVSGNRIDVVEGSADLRVSGMLVTRVEGKERREVQREAELVHAADLTTRVLGCVTTLVGKSDKKRTWLAHAEGNAELSGSDRVKVVSDKELMLTVGKSSIRITPDRIELHAPTVTTTGQGGAMSVGDEGLKLKSKDDAQLTMGKGMELKTESASVSMGKEVEVKGEKIKLNSPSAPSGGSAAPPEPPTKVELVDQDGNPLPYQRFVARMDDRTEIGGKTGRDGKAEVDIPSGGKIVFPDLTMPGDTSGTGDPQPYVVRQGDYLSKLAFVQTFDGNQVWGDGKNADLQQQRRDPNVLAPGDLMFVPQARKEGQPINKGTSNRYQVNVPKVKVELLFRDGEQPLAGEACEVRGLGKQDPEVPTSTDGGGKLSLNVPVTAREFYVDFPNKEGLGVHLYVGDVDPVSAPAGVAQRLVNLGYLPAYFDDDPDSAAGYLERALKAFQAENGLEPTGTADDATRQALLGDHQV